ncbi:transposase, partial [Streptomyces ardesiacus]
QRPASARQPTSSDSSTSTKSRSNQRVDSRQALSPLPASSGNTTRHRLNRGGDRRLNRALNVIAMVRMVHHPQTRSYVERRRTEGKTDREIRRCLKRYLARRLYRHLNNAATAMGGDGV